jgi:endothelin-converting enzyme
LFAGLGSVLGHEFSHAFDQTGSQYDIAGNVGKDWWSAETRKRFHNRTECFVGQYSNYTIPDVNLHVNGNRTADENIADSGGLKISYNVGIAINS